MASGYQDRITSLHKDKQIEILELSQQSVSHSSMKVLVPGIYVKNMGGIACVCNFSTVGGKG